MMIKHIVAATTVTLLGVFGAAYAPTARADECFSVRRYDSWGRPYTRIECYRTLPYRSYSYVPPRRTYDYDYEHRLWHERNDRRLIDRDPWSNRNWQFDHQRWHDLRGGRHW